MEFGFECNKKGGKVAAYIKPGSELGGEGFPICIATVEFGGEGYDAFFGWVQLVRSTDNNSEGRQFEMDPFFLFQDCTSPYCFFGFKPTLFDAPSRQTKKPMSWLAHSFLAFTPPDPELFTKLNSRRVTFLAGFSWGFNIDSQRNIMLRSINKLGSIEWNSHLAFLLKNYPTWRFDEVKEPV
ncbi:MAG: hypothetical protein ACRECH_14700 [Nitrososphaerales archaeon]